MQDTIDAVTGRRVRQASQAASQAIAETVHWFQHNPYRVSAADGAGDAGDAPRPDGAAIGTAAPPHGKPEGGAEGEAAGGSEHVGALCARAARFLAHFLAHCAVPQRAWRLNVVRVRGVGE